MLTTVGEASRKNRCRPLRATESTPALVSFARWVLAVCGVIRAAPASSLAVRARPSMRADSMVALAGSPTSAAISAMIGPVIMSSAHIAGVRGPARRPEDHGARGRDLDGGRPSRHDPRFAWALTA